MILHNTCQPNIYYTSFDNLPSIIKDFIIKECGNLIVEDNSSYTVFESMAFIRHDATIDGVAYSIELSLGKLNGCTLDQVLESVEFESLDAYLTVI